MDGAQEELSMDEGHREEEDTEQDDTKEEDNEEDLFSIVLRVKGCVFSELQPNVQALWILGLEAQNAEFRLQFEPENPIDRNDIA